MRRMVGLIQRQGIFYYRRTIPEPLRRDMPVVLRRAASGPGIFDDDAAVFLRGSRAGREFWISLRTRDATRARVQARKLDAEADRLFELAERCSDAGKRPSVTELPEEAVESLVATFRYRKLAEDEQHRREARPLSKEEHEALGRDLATREAELRDAKPSHASDKRSGLPGSAVTSPSPNSPSGWEWLDRRS